MSINNVVLMGRMAADPDLRVTNSGKSVCSFRIAVDRDFVKAGEQREADFITCVAWEQTASFIEKYFSKGSMIAVTGAIQTRSYEDNSGTKRYMTEVNVRNASFCGGKSEEKPTQETAPQYTISQEQDFEEIGEEEGLPF